MRSYIKKEYGDKEKTELLFTTNNILYLIKLYKL